MTMLLELALTALYWPCLRTSIGSGAMGREEACRHMEKLDGGEDEGATAVHTKNCGENKRRCRITTLQPACSDQAVSQLPSDPTFLDLDAYTTCDYEPFEGDNRYLSLYRVLTVKEKT